MPEFPVSTARAGRRHPLALSVLSLFATCTGAAQAVNVLSCGDNGIGDIGNLRNSIDGAPDGATIDLTQLPCSEISLHNGQIVISQTDLTIKGPGMNALGITGIFYAVRQPYRIFRHTGTGTLAIRDVRLSDGYATYSGAALGGCIRSSGSVDLEGVSIEGCSARSTGVGAGILAQGGGVYAASGLTLHHSEISNNVAGLGDEPAFGGGFFVQDGPLHMYDSTVSGNHAGTNGPYGFSGGGFAQGDAVISASTISGNVATYRIGGLGITATPGGMATISNSTISGNTAIDDIGGGVFISGASTVHIDNSTVAFNKSGAISAGFGTYAPGLAIYAPGAGTVSVTLQSSLFSNNVFGAGANAYDLSIKNGSTVSGANNLVHITGSVVPDDTKLGAQACPLLGPLRDNGGPTSTHALASNSPAIDAGNNAAALANDQRGVPFARVSGAGADIGAYEADEAEVILIAGFEGCPG